MGLELFIGRIGRHAAYLSASLLSLNLTYRTNVLLPTGIALGRSVSHGFGRLVPARVKGANRAVIEKEQYEVGKVK